MRSLKLKNIGDGRGVVIPEDILVRMKVGKTANLYMTETPDGAVKLTPYDPDVDLQMRATRIGMFKYKKAMRALAK